MFDFPPRDTLGNGSKYFLRLYLTLFAMAIIYAFPILVGDRYYIDDIGRSIWGYSQGGKEGRPLADWLFALLTFQFPFSKTLVIDISPLPQIFALSFLSFSATFLCMKLFPEDVRDFSSVIVVFPVIGSPYLLEIISYKFDSLTISLAICLSIISAFEHTYRIRDILTGAFLLLMSLCLYQSATSTFFGTTALLVLSSFYRGQSSTYTIIVNNCIKFLISILFYYILVIPFFFQIGEHVHSHLDIIPFDADGIIYLSDNIKSFLYIVYEYFFDAYILGILSIVSVVAFSLNFLFLNNNRYEGFATRTLVLFGCIIVITLSVGGLQLLLTDPVIKPRTLVGAAILFVFILYCYRESFGRLYVALKILLLVPLLYQYVIAYGYAAAAKQQTQYDIFLASSIIRKLEDNGFSVDDYLVFDGQQPKSPVFRNSGRRFEIINRIVHLPIHNQRIWGYLYLRHFAFEFQTFHYSKVNEQFKRSICQGKPISETQEYKIFKNDNVFIVSFENGTCFSAPGE